MSSSSTGRPAFWAAVVLGWGVIAFGVVGLLDRFGARGTLDVGLWVVGGNVLHDAVIAPIAFVVAVGLALVVRRPWRAPLLAGLATSAMVVAVAYPALRGFGREANNPSLLPLDYGTAVLTVLAVVWGGVLAWAGIILIRRRIERSARSRSWIQASSAHDCP